MLLRRISKHLHDQNWFAVLVDFIIVVVGVFIGIQVANWNDGNRERRLEARSVERLHEEVATLIQVRDKRRRFAAFIRDGLDEASRTLFEIDRTGELSDGACQAIVLSHIYLAQPDDLPVVEELLETGRIDIIRNAGLRRSILNFVRARDRGRSTLEAVGRDIYKFSLHHPDLISVWMVGRQDAPELEPEMRCDSDGMRKDQLFKNALVGNRAIHAEYFGQLFTAVDDELATLEAELGRK